MNVIKLLCAQHDGGLLSYILPLKGCGGLSGVPAHATKEHMRRYGTAKEAGLKPNKVPVPGALNIPAHPFENP